MLPQLSLSTYTTYFFVGRNKHYVLETFEVKVMGYNKTINNSIMVK